MLTHIFGLLLIGASCTAAQSIVRPCDLSDYACVRDILVAHSRCNPDVKGSVSSHYLVHKFLFETPSYKASNIETNLHVWNHDKCFLSEFFFDYDKDVTVMSIDCPRLLWETDRTVIKHYSLQEDVYYTFHAKIINPLMRLTLNIPHINAIEICSAFVFGDFTELPIYYVNPGDRVPPNLLSDSNQHYYYELESYAARASPIAKIFIQSILCNFGCKFNETITDLS